MNDIGLTHMKDGHPVMVDVSGKSDTHRRAVAEGWVVMSPELRRAVAQGVTSKGDVLSVAELAGIAAMKRTPELIPLCHPLRLSHCSVTCRIEPDRGVHIRSEATATDATGVEMEALTGVSVAALTVYDMCKALDKKMEIGDIRLLEKSGGKSGEWVASLEEPSRCPEEPPKPKGVAAVLTVSDRTFSGQRKDRSGPALVRRIREMGWSVAQVDVVPDDGDRIVEILRRWVDEDGIDLIVCTGGTGLSPRDVTPEALLSVSQRQVPGLGERMRSYSSAFTDRAALSRCLAVTRGTSLILALPGSEAGARQCLDAVASVLSHAVEVAGGRGEDCGTSRWHHRKE